MGLVSAEQVAHVVRTMPPPGDAGRVPLGRALVDSGILDANEFVRIMQSMSSAGSRSRSRSNTESSATGPASPSGDRTIGPYRVLEELGRGAFGVVYRARRHDAVDPADAADDADDADVALKVLMNRDGGRDNRVERFQRECRIIARLSHPHIVHIQDWGEDSGVHWYAMELLDGEGLDELLARSTLSWQAAVHLVEIAARTVHFAHERGVIHRDLKPANIHIDGSRRPRILDFGLARIVGGDEAALTADGKTVGTPTYMSPEQCRGQRDAIDFRTDIFSLGVILYELLTGRRPFDARSRVELFEQICVGDPPPLGDLVPDLPPDLTRIVGQALSKGKAARQPSARALAHDLGLVRAGRAVDTPWVTSEEPPPEGSDGPADDHVLQSAMRRGLLTQGQVSEVLSERKRLRAEGRDIDAARILLGYGWLTAGELESIAAGTGGAATGAAPPPLPSTKPPPRPGRRRSRSGRRRRR